MSEKRINNILAVLSKPLRYAAECNLIARVPRMGMFKVERPDRGVGLRAVRAHPRRGEGRRSEWYAGVCRAGEAGLRVGEVKALRWREDVDMIARTITVNQQTRNNETTMPKARTRRSIPMTGTLHAAIKQLETIREGFVVRNRDGSQKTDGEADLVMRRICRRAGLPVHGFHRLRHSFGTHAALFGVNPWRLQAWMGHKRIDETMLYVHVAETHARELPEEIRAAAIAKADPDERILRTLGARGTLVPRSDVRRSETEVVTAA